MLQREKHTERDREREGPREREHDRVRERIAVRAEVPMSSRDLAHHSHARTLVAGGGACGIIAQSAAYVTVKRRPLASISTPAVGR